MNFHIITPLARFQNFNELYKSLSVKNVIWHIITDEGFNPPTIPNENWINHYVCPNNEGEFWARCNYSINWFLDNNELMEEDYYCILNDDDDYESDFFKKLYYKIEDSNTKNEFNDLIICSMLRGNNIPVDAIPVRRHPNDTLIAHPNNMHVGGVGVEQFLIKGKLLKNHRLPISVTGDGELIGGLVNMYGALYIPDNYILFNYFEPGRWNK